MKTRHTLMSTIAFAMVACVDGAGESRNAHYGAYLTDEEQSLVEAIEIEDDASYLEVHLYDRVDGDNTSLMADVRFVGRVDILTQSIRDIDETEIPVSESSNAGDATSLRASFTAEERRIEATGTLSADESDLQLRLTVEGLLVGELDLDETQDSQF